MIKEYCKLFIEFVKKYYIPLCAFALYAVITYAFSITNCASKLTIGLPCPGCGLTRAAFSLIRFDFVKAFEYNPIIFFVPIVVWIIIFHQRPFINRIYKSKIFWITLLLLIISIYIVRFIYVYPNCPMEYHEENLFHWIIFLFQ